MKILYRNLLISGVLIAIIIGYLIIHQTQASRFLGDHITIHLKVMLDGEELSLEDLKAHCTFENEVVAVNSNNGTYKTKGGEYGLYYFDIIIPSERLGKYKNDVILNLKYINANNWYISESDCIVYLYTDETGTIYADKAIINIEYNDETAQYYERNINLKNNSLNIYWGL